MKHLQKQKEGKKKLRSLSIGKVEIPQEAFSAVSSPLFFLHFFEGTIDKRVDCNFCVCVLLGLEC
jgi:hypothetical protein